MPAFLLRLMPSNRRWASWFLENLNDRLSADEVKKNAPERLCRKEEYEQGHVSFSPVQEMASEF
jgi:hypothetical protein